MPAINLKKNILLSGSFRIVILVLSLIFSWLSARYLGVELKGKLSYMLTMGGFIWIVLDLGLSRSYPYLVRKTPEKTQSLFNWTLMTFFSETGFLLVVGLGLIHIWSNILGFQFSVPYMGLFVLYIVLAKFFTQLQALLIGQDKVFANSLAHLLSSLICMLIMVAGFFLIRNTDRLMFVLLASLSGTLISSIYMLHTQGFHSLSCRFDFGFIKTAYGYGIRVFISSLFILLLIRSDIIIIKYLLGFKQVGIYSIGAHIVDLLQMVSNLVGGLLLVKLADTNDDISKWLLMKRILMVFFVFLSLANLGFILVGKTVLSVMFGTQFVPAYGTYLLLIPASYGLSFGSLFNQYQNSRGFPIISIILPALALGLNIALDFILIPVWGIAGASIATSIAYLGWFSFILVYEQKYTQNQILKHLIPHIADWTEVWNMFSHSVVNFKNKLIRKKNASDANQ